ncbi:MAG: WD40/YVTN/BNR-like repeat-containing protein [Acidimicrobiales bacterium]
MLLVGTSTHLEDLDRQLSLAEDVSVDAIATNAPAGSGSDVYVLLDRGRIARVGDFDLEPVAKLPAADAQSIAVADGRFLVGRAGAHLSAVDVDGTVTPLDAFEGVAGRDAWENPAGPSPDVRSIAVTAAGTWLVNIHVGGVWRSTDGGGSWQGVVPADTDVHEVVAGADGAVAIAAAGGFGWSTDDGLSWEWTSEGLHDVYCRAVALDGDTAYLSASSGPRSRDGRLYRGRLGGRFEACTGGLPESFPSNIDTGAVAAAGGRVAIGAPSGEIWRSTDAGSGFRRVTERVRSPRVLRFA